MENQVPNNCKTSESKSIWPFPIYNDQRTEESQKLLNTKRFPKQKEDTSDWEEALF